MKLIKKVYSVVVIRRLLVLVGICVISLTVPTNIIYASTVQFSSGSDWNSGTLSGLTSSVKEGQVELSPAGSWGARSWKSPDLVLGVGSAFASDGTDIYVTRGYGDVRFWKYSPASDSWTSLTNLPNGTYYGSDFEYFDGYIYAIFGSYQKTFARYSITNNSWELLQDVPDLIYDGGSIATDGTYIYALKGNSSQDFYRYDVSANSWSSMAGTPSTMRRGSDLVYSNGAFYTPRGQNGNTFYKYTIATNSWSTMATIPGTVYDDINITTDGTSIFLARQNNTTYFYKYNIAADSWSIITNLPANSRYAGVVYNAGDGFIYVFRGNGQYHFWKYDIVNDQFVGPENTPSTLYTGADLVYYDNKLYGPRGYNSTTFYSYDIANNTWSTKAVSPVSFYDDTKGVAAGTNLYFFRGYNTTDFYRYTPETDSWTQMADAPSTVRFGGTLVYPGSGDYIYATRGNSQYTFWRYSISANSWDDASVTDLPTDARASYGSRLTTDGTDIYYIPGIGVSRLYKYVINSDSWSEIGAIPFAPYYGTDISYYNGKIYATSGWYETDFWEYTIATNTWRKLDSFSGYRAQNVGAYAGSSLENNGSGSFYLSLGGALVDILEYTVSANKYTSTGYWESEAQNLGYVSSWSNFSSTVTTTSDSTVTYATQTSDNGITWDSWQTVNGNTINSTPRRYLKVKAILTASTGLVDTPILKDITVTYTGDTSAPTNPTAIVGLSQEVGGSALTSGESYKYISPYFSWTGASDSEVSVAGYYVYFGTNSAADPEVSGIYQTSTSYKVTTAFSTGTYYLIIKTKDTAGNISNSSTLFTYNYNGISPAQSLTMSTTSDFSGVTSDVNITNDKLRLSNESGGFWIEKSLSSTPASMQYGARNVAYVASDNDIYVFHGANTTTFYKYDIDTDTWSTLAPAPATVRMGGGITEGPSGYLYAMRGNNSTSFWRYDIAADTWSDEDASDAPLTIYYGGSLNYDGSQYIYVMRGNNDDAFWRYDTNFDSWETLSSIDFGANSDSINNNAYIGADMAIDQSGNIIYATAGNFHDGFSQYDINTNKWTVLADLPALPYLGSSIEYDATTESVFFMPGYYSDFLYQYSIANQSWTQKASAPATFYYGGTLKNVGGNFYAIRGGNTTSFYKYNIAKDSWLTPTGGLFSRIFQGVSYETEYYGADILKGDGDNFYLIRGSYADDFVRWNQTTGETVNLTNLPSGAFYGANLVYDSTQNKIYYAAGIYNRRFYVYDIATDEWSEEVSDPPPMAPYYGSSMVYDGSRYIYLARAGNSRYFYRFDTQGSNGEKWTTMALVPANAGYGAELLLNGNYIYMLRGQNVDNNPFYRYDILNDTWSTLNNIGANIYNDGFLADGGDGNFYAARGGNHNDFFKYSVVNNSWSQIDNAPAKIYAGGSGESNGVNKIYMLSGSGTGSVRDGIYTYVMEGESSGFKESGTYTSQTHDLSSVYRWANLKLTYSSADNTELAIKTHSSSDGSTWSAWTSVSAQKQNGNVYYYKINSPANRYLELQFSFTSSDGVLSGIIDDYSIYYYKDESAPTNPDTNGLSVYSDNAPGDAIVSGAWYRYPNPYFDWPEAEATNGASDTSAGSGVAGYYVYFGTDASADPESNGTLQTDTNFTASNLTSGSTYYFRVKTIDDAGNISSSIWQPFIYKYDADGPSTPTSLIADPAGYTATNSFDFTWDEATASGALVTNYCYKTGTSSGILASDQCITGTSITDIPAYKNGANIFYVRAKDDANNFSDYMTTSYFYADPNDPSTKPAPPTNLTVDPSPPDSSTTNSFSFDWDPPVDGSFYGSVSNLSYYYSINALPTEQSTTATSLTHLNAGAFATLDGENTFYITTKDEAGNIDYSNYVSQTFKSSAAAPGIPLNIDIADVSVKATESWKLAISWEQPVDTGSGVASYSVYRSLDGINFSEFSTSGGISYVDVGLDQQTYYYKVRACNNSNACGAFSEVVSLFPDGKFVQPATLIAEPTETNVTTRKATISWSTDRTCDSKIAYGTSSGNYLDEEVSNSMHVTSHILALSNLSPGTTYYYVAKWTDEDGNTGISDEKTFETQPPPTTEEPVVKSVGLDTALIEFTSSHADRIRIYYGESSTFGGIEDLVTGSNKSIYTVQLKNLSDGTKYFYKINAFDSEGEEYEGETHSFTTLPRPKVENIKIHQVKGTARSTLLVTWESNTEVTSVITYYPVVNPGAAKDEVNIALKNGKHQMVIYDLEPQTTYAIIIKGKDAVGNEAIGEMQQVATSMDTRAPLISNLKVETEISGTGEEAMAQLVVSYKTDEPATAQIEFGEGSGTTYSQKTQEDSGLTTHHLVVISGLSPAKVYHLRAVSKDQYGNKAESLDKVTITQKATENALDLVISNLSVTFGFLGGRK